MRVLISWSGQRSKLIAAAMHEFLGRVIQATEPWMSDKDISAGTVWLDELLGALEGAKAGILCLTPEMLKSEWVHLEAGALVKAVSKRCVAPYLFDMHFSDVQGPLSFFQGNLATKEGTLRIVASINELMTDKKKLSEQGLKVQFEAHWPWFESELNKVRAIKVGEVTKPKKRSPDDVMEEVLAGIRSIQNLLSLVRFQQTTDGDIGGELVAPKNARLYLGPRKPARTNSERISSLEEVISERLDQLLSAKLEVPIKDVVPDESNEKTPEE